MVVLLTQVDIENGRYDWRAGRTIGNHALPSSFLNPLRSLVYHLFFLACLSRVAIITCGSPTTAASTCSTVLWSSKTATLLAALVASQCGCTIHPHCPPVSSTLALGIPSSYIPPCGARAGLPLPRSVTRHLPHNDLMIRPSGISLHCDAPVQLCVR